MGKIGSQVFEKGMGSDLCIKAPFLCPTICGDVEIDNISVRVRIHNLFETVYTNVPQALMKSAPCTTMYSES